MINDEKPINKAESEDMNEESLETVELALKLAGGIDEENDEITIKAELLNQLQTEGQPIVFEKIVDDIAEELAWGLRFYDGKRDSKGRVEAIKAVLSVSPRLRFLTASHLFSSAHDREAKTLDVELEPMTQDLKDWGIHELEVGMTRWFHNKERSKDVVGVYQQLFTRALEFDDIRVDRNMARQTDGTYLDLNDLELLRDAFYRLLKSNGLLSIAMPKDHQFYWLYKHFENLEKRKVH